MLKKSVRALIVVTVLTTPCFSFAAQLGPGMPSPDPVFKNPQNPKLGPGMPSPDPVFKNPQNPKLGPGMPSPDPVFKNPQGKN